MRPGLRIKNFHELHAENYHVVMLARIKDKEKKSIENT